MGIYKKVTVGALSLLLLIAANHRAGAAHPATVAEALPPDTLAFIEVSNIKALCEKFKQTSYYALYQAADMQPFVGPTEKNLKDKINELLKEGWRDLELDDPPEEFPIPQGQIGLAFHFEMKTSLQPDMSKVDYDQMTPSDWENFDPETLPKHEVTEPAPQIVFWAQMGENLEEAKKLAKRLEAKTLEESILLQRETVRGTPITIFKSEGESDINFDTFCYGFKDDCLILGSSFKLVQECLIRMGQHDRPTLAQEGGYRTITQKLNAADIRLHLNGTALIQMIKEFTGAEELAKTTRIMDTLGVSNLAGLGYTIQLAPHPGEDMRASGYLAVQGKKKGIPKILSPISQPVNFNRLLPKGAASFIVAHYDVGSIYDQILQMVATISGFNPTPMLDGMLAMTGDPAGGQPPVNLRQDVLGQLAPTITLVNGMDKPFDAPDSMKMLLALGVRDAQTLDNALGRVHSTFVAQGNPEMQRKLLGTAIYLIPGSEEFWAMMMASQGINVDDKSKLRMAFAVAGDQLILSTTDQVEQSIRNLQRDDLQGIKTDPMFQHVARYLPDRAGLISYENVQLSTERTWWMVKEAARKAALEPDTASEATGDSLDNFENTFALELATGKAPMQIVVQALSDYVDFTALPDYQSVKQYFGAGIGYVTETPNGIYADIVVVKAPQ